MQAGDIARHIRMQTDSHQRVYVPYPAAGAASSAWLGSVCCCRIVAPCGSWTLAATLLSAPPPSALPPPNNRSVAVNSCGCAAPAACTCQLHDLAPHGAEHQHAHPTATFICADSHNETLDVTEPTCRNVSDVHCRLPGGSSILTARVAHANARSMRGTTAEHGRIRWCPYPETDNLGGASAHMPAESWLLLTAHCVACSACNNCTARKGVCFGQPDNQCT